jgi:hypothetical protein
MRVHVRVCAFCVVIAVLLSVEKIFFDALQAQLTFESHQKEVRRSTGLRAICFSHIFIYF